jgi:hypothetical protein
VPQQSRAVRLCVQTCLLPHTAGTHPPPIHLLLLRRRRPKGYGQPQQHMVGVNAAQQQVVG